MSTSEIGTATTCGVVLLGVTVVGCVLLIATELCICARTCLRLQKSTNEKDATRLGFGVLSEVDDE